MFSHANAYMDGSSVCLFQVWHDQTSACIPPLPCTVVPPPMCAVTAALPAPVNCLAVRDFGYCEVSWPAWLCVGLAARLTIVSSVWLAHSLSSFQGANPPACCRPAHLLACLQAIAAVLSDGSLALLSSVEEDLWEETLDEQLEAHPWDRCHLGARAGSCVVDAVGSVQTGVEEGEPISAPAL